MMMWLVFFNLNITENKVGFFLDCRRTKNVIPIYFVHPTFLLLMFLVLPCATRGVSKQVRDVLKHYQLNTANQSHLGTAATTFAKKRRV